MDKYQVGADLFAKVAEKSRRHAINNPYSMFSRPLTYQQVIDDKVIYGNYLTRLMACPPTCGAAAVIVCSEEFARQHGIASQVKILAQSMATDTEISWQDPINAVGKAMTQQAVEQVYCDAGIVLAILM
ncbi:hypothetical protein [Shewanella phaeophyticola]|uniref:Thiolase N-terminal domain-containing protein n=1 Tax=Shewanella phaeophyticola TaxID=2978345 RepID=A0ABT2P5E7_9GAMM|nr:hypothetical protein [Shewanella sp. KJ10-1]MCT8987591.1 hypothetical protein [Shewanella sp. KJ10-1]